MIQGGRLPIADMDGALEQGPEASSELRAVSGQHQTRNRTSLPPHEGLKPASHLNEPGSDFFPEPTLRAADPVISVS